MIALSKDEIERYASWIFYDPHKSADANFMQIEYGTGGEGGKHWWMPFAIRAGDGFTHGLAAQEHAADSPQLASAWRLARMDDRLLNDMVFGMCARTMNADQDYNWTYEGGQFFTQMERNYYHTKDVPMTYGNIRTFCYERLPGRYDCRIPDKAGIESLCSKYAKEHPYLWEDRDSLDGRRALWLLWVMDPTNGDAKWAKDRSSSGKSYGYEDWQIVSIAKDLPTSSVGREHIPDADTRRKVGDAMLERAAITFENTYPRWQTGDLSTRHTVTDYNPYILFHLDHHEDYDADPTNGCARPDTQRAKAMQEIDDLVEPCIPMDLNRSYTTFDATVDVRMHELDRALANESAAKRRIMADKAAMSAGRGGQNDLSSAEAGLKSSQDELKRVCTRTIPDIIDASKPFMDVVHNVIRPLVTDYENAGNKLHAELAKRYWSDVCDDKIHWANSKLDRTRDVIASHGWAWELYQVDPRYVNKETRKQFDEYSAKKQAAIEEYEDYKREQKIRKAQLDDAVFQNEVNRQVRNRLGVSKPGDDIPADERTMIEREKMMKKTGLAYEDLYDDDPDHDYDPANWG